MGADRHPTSVPSNFDEIEDRLPEPDSSTAEKKRDKRAGERGLYHLWLAEECQAALEPSFIYIDAPSATEATIRGHVIAIAFGATCACQVDVRPVEVYV